jgi:uncharacterized repeat protein (TIGR01451 family)
MEANIKKLSPVYAQRIYNFLYWVVAAWVYLTFTNNTFGQSNLVCNYKSGTFNMTLEGHTTGVGFSSRLVLTDQNGVIKYVTPVNSTTFQNVLAGNYLAYGITYQNATYIPNLEVGRNISLVSTCYKTVVVPTKVCNCNNDTGNLASSPIDIPVDKTVSYVLTDGKGNIILIRSQSTFEGNPDGVYNIIPITYQQGSYPVNFEIGKNINTVSGINLVVGIATGYVVCLPQNPVLSVTKRAPSTAIVGSAFNYTITTKNIGNTVTQGIVTVTDTLAQGLSFQKTESNSGWSCQASNIVVGNVVRALVSCQTSNLIAINESQEVVFSVIAQRTGVFINQAFVQGGGSIGLASSNKVQTVINECREVCVPLTIKKSRKTV